MPAMQQPNVDSYPMPGRIQSDHQLAQFFRLQRRAFTAPNWPEYNFTRFRGRKNNFHRSQHGQSEMVDDLLNRLSGGFFVESGAFDAEQLSNSLFFEQVCRAAAGG